MACTCLQLRLPHWREGRPLRQYKQRCWLATVGGHTAAWLIVVVFVSPIVGMPRARPVKWDGVVPFSPNSVSALRGSHGKC
jgi:hypothetical protein